MKSNPFTSTSSRYEALLQLGVALTVIAGCERAPTEFSVDADARIQAINERYVFADMHAHPSRFHRANRETIAADEIERYRSRHMDVVVANVSSDMAFSGGYENRDGTTVERGRYKPEPGLAFELAMDRLARLQRTFELGIAVQGKSPDVVAAARAADKVVIIPALEGADALEGSIENFRAMVDAGLRLIQVVHFRANELGHIQTYPYSPGGLTEFGRDVVREANRLGVVIDLAHANTETIMDVLAMSQDPVIFSHGGLKALYEQDRALSDDEIRAIAEAGGVVGIWPNGASVADVSFMVDLIEHVISVGGADHVGIGSDLRGMSRYAAGFGEDAEFRAIARELLERGHDDDTVGKVMGGNFFRVWQAVASASAFDAPN